MTALLNTGAIRKRVGHVYTMITRASLNVTATPWHAWT